MPELKPYQPIELLPAGTIATIDLTLSTERYLIFTTGLISLAASCSISPTGTAIAGMSVSMKYIGRLDMNKKDVTVFGTKMTQEQLSHNCDIECVYDGSAWAVKILISDDIDQKPVSGEETIKLTAAGGILNVHPRRNAKIINVTGNATLVGNVTLTSSGAAWGIENLGDTFYVKYRATMVLNGFKLSLFGYTLTAYQAVKGGLLLRVSLSDLSGTTKWDVVVISDVSVNGDSEIIHDVVIIQPPQVSQLNSVPPVIVAAPGAGKINKLIDSAITNDFHSIGYVSADTVNIAYDGGASSIHEYQSDVLTASSRQTYVGKTTDSAVSLEALENKALVLISASDPTYGWGYLYGDSPLIVFLSYKILSV